MCLFQRWSVLRAKPGPTAGSSANDNNKDLKVRFPMTQLICGSRKDNSVIYEAACSMDIVRDIGQTSHFGVQVTV